MPDEILMTLVGYLSSIFVLQYIPSLMVCFVGTMTGMTVSYFIGKRVGKPLLERYGKWVFLTAGKMAKVEKWFHRYGPWTIVFGYFIPGVRHLTCYFSGITGMGYKKYLLISGLGAFAWCLIFITLGYFVGLHAWEQRS